MGKVLPCWTGPLAADSKHHGCANSRNPSPMLLSPHPALLFAEQLLLLPLKTSVPPAVTPRLCKVLCLLRRSLGLAKRSEAADSIASLLSNSCGSGSGLELVSSTLCTSRNTFVVHEPEERVREVERDLHTETHCFRKDCFSSN